MTSMISEFLDHLRIFLASILAVLLVLGHTFVFNPVRAATVVAWRILRLVILEYQQQQLDQDGSPLLYPRPSTSSELARLLEDPLLTDPDTGPDTVTPNTPTARASPALDSRDVHYEELQRHREYERLVAAAASNSSAPSEELQDERSEIRRRRAHRQVTEVNMQQQDEDTAAAVSRAMARVASLSAVVSVLREIDDDNDNNGDEEEGEADGNDNLVYRELLENPDIIFFGDINGNNYHDDEENDVDEHDSDMENLVEWLLHATDTPEDTSVDGSALLRLAGPSITTRGSPHWRNLEASASLLGEDGEPNTSNLTTERNGDSTEQNRLRNSEWRRAAARERARESVYGLASGIARAHGASSRDNRPRDFSVNGIINNDRDRHNSNGSGNSGSGGGRSQRISENRSALLSSQSSQLRGLGIEPGTSASRFFSQLSFSSQHLGNTNVGSSSQRPPAVYLPVGSATTRFTQTQTPPPLPNTTNTSTTTARSNLPTFPPLAMSSRNSRPNVIPALRGAANTVAGANALGAAAIEAAVEAAASAAAGIRIVTNTSSNNRVSTRLLPGTNLESSSASNTTNASNRQTSRWTRRASGTGNTGTSSSSASPSSGEGFATFPPKTYSDATWAAFASSFPMSKTELNALIMNYLIVEGYQSAALKFSREANVPIASSTLLANSESNPSEFGSEFSAVAANSSSSSSSSPHSSADFLPAGLADDTTPGNMYFRKEPPVFSLDSVHERMVIKSLILTGSIQQAIEKINDVDPELLDTNSGLHFSLLRLQLIELIRAANNARVQRNSNNNKSSDEGSTISNDIELIQPALDFASSHLARRAPANPKFLEYLEQTMALLCFPPDKLVPQLQELMDPKMRKIVAQEVNTLLLARQGISGESNIHSLIRLWGWAEHELVEHEGVSIPLLNPSSLVN